MILALFDVHAGHELGVGISPIGREVEEIAENPVDISGQAASHWGYADVGHGHYLLLFSSL